MRMRSGWVALVVLGLLALLLGACGDEIEATRGGPSPEVQRLVEEIDLLLQVPQESYPDGFVLSDAFERLHEAVGAQERTLRTNQVAQKMGYFIATGHGVGSHPEEVDVANLASSWREFRPEVLAGP